MIALIFRSIHTIPGINDKNANGASQPPKNIMDVRAEITNILVYSAKKNKAKPIPEYSVM